MKFLTIIMTLSLALAFTLNLQPASAERLFTLQYSAGDSSEAHLLGLGLYNTDTKLYFNSRITMAPEPHYDALNINSFGDPVRSRFNDWMILNVGTVTSLGQSLSAYIGVGYSSGKGKARKHDPDFILASDGKYFVDDPVNDTSDVNFNAGLLFKISEKWIAEVGYDTTPGIMYFGGGAKF